MKLIQSLIPKELKRKMKPICLNGYYDIKSFAFSKKYRKIRNRIQDKSLRKEKINILFFLQYPEMWNSVKAVYETMIADNRFQVTIITFPKRKMRDGNNQFEEDNVAHYFCVDNKMDDVQAYFDKQWLDLKTLKPDYIFIQRPYDEYVPEQYKMDCLSEIALLCYVSYSGHLTEGIHLDIEFNKPCMRNMYLYFADNSSVAQYVIKNSQVYMKKGLRKIYELGFPRFDLLNKDSDTLIKPCLTFLWTPRWSVDEANDRSHFLDYFDFLLDFFTNHPELNLIIRPHPLMFDNFIARGVLTDEGVQSIKTRVQKTGNISFDQNMDYYVTFEKSDALISDPTSLLLEYFATEKPIVYLGNKYNDLNENAKCMFRQFYLAENELELNEHLVHLMKGNDYLKQNRIQIVQNVFLSDGRASKRIIDTIYKDSIGE